MATCLEETTTTIEESTNADQDTQVKTALQQQNDENDNKSK